MTGRIPHLVFLAVCVFASTFQVVGQSSKWSESGTGSIQTILNKGGAALGYSATSGVKILTVDGFAFKDLNKNGKLDKYEDWRLPAEERAKDLASKMTIDQIAGLMLYSGHQAIPNTGGPGGAAGSYGGKPFAQSGAQSSDLTDQQREFLTKDNLRHVLITSVESPETAALSLRMSRPTVVAEFEREAAAILATFGVQDQAVMDVLTGAVAPSGLLPFQVPSNMKTVEQQREDVPMDMECHVDSDGNTYDFAFGLNWSGAIKDLRTAKYKRSRRM